MAEAEGFGPCIYSDLSHFEDGPPVESGCPTPAHPNGAVCGGDCASCAFPDGALFESWDNFGVACIGVSETRGFGVCTLDTGSPCRAPADGLPSFASHLIRDHLCESEFGVPCTCLVRKRDGVLDRTGWAIVVPSCRGYRDSYPGDWSCVDYQTWTEVE